MKRVRVLLVDDEPLANAGLRALLKSHPDFEVVAEALGGKDAIREWRVQSPDLLFLDIQMPRIDGFAVLREIMKEAGSHFPLVIFVTAFDEFAVNAFDVQALDYLLKPVSEERFRRALDRVRQLRATDDAQRRTTDLERRLRLLLDEVSARERSAEPTPHYPERLMIGSGNRAVVVEVGAIDWIGARDYCAELHVGGTSHVMRESLAALESELDPSLFVRIHRSAIVNSRRVVELRRAGLRGLEVVLNSGERIPVSRGRKRELSERFGKPR